MSDITFHKFSWQDIERDCLQLYKAIQGVHVDTIVAVSRGGLVWARMLSDFLNKPISHITILSYKNLKKTQDPFIDEAPSRLFKDEQLVIVDEVCDTGKTFQRAVAYFQNFPVKKIYTASPYLKRHSTFIPDFWVKQLDAWIIFPYEIRETVEAFAKLFPDANQRKRKLTEVGFEEWELTPFHAQTAPRAVKQQPSQQD